MYWLVSVFWNGEIHEEVWVGQQESILEWLDECDCFQDFMVEPCDWKGVVLDV